MGASVNLISKLIYQLHFRPKLILLVFVGIGRRVVALLASDSELCVQVRDRKRETGAEIVLEIPGLICLDLLYANTNVL